jgi:phosphatidylglycerophosphatase A
VRLWIAQGFGVGRIPFAPGTWGSVLGLVWFGLLLGTGHVWSYVLGMAAGVGVSVWLCGSAEKILGQKDPSSVVLDEITAMPVCFSSWIATCVGRTGRLPTLDSFLIESNALLAAVVFVGFRLFDIWKPWPVRQSQELPGGWGVTMDDVLAASYVALLVLLINTLKVKWQAA